jgi:fermentation-respiration switch protein FrsA (DUF1100 family)
MVQRIRPSRRVKLAIGLLVSLLFTAACTSAATQVVTFLAVHPPRERPSLTPADLGLAYEDVAFTTSDGLELKGWFVPSAYSQAAVILGHGFTRSRQEMLDIAAMLNRHCYNVLLFDWRAHGESAGSRTTFGYEEVKDLSAALDYAMSRPEVDPQRIGVLGKSLGAVIAIRGAAVLPQIKAVVSDSPFTSLQDTIEATMQRHGPLGVWPLRQMALFLGVEAMGIDPDLVRPIDDIGKISPRPVLIMHGGRDQLVPADSGERLYTAAAEPKSLWYVPDAAHVQLSELYPRQYEARVTGFFNAALRDGVAAICAVRASVPASALQP